MEISRLSWSSFVLAGSKPQIWEKLNPQNNDDKVNKVHFVCKFCEIKPDGAGKNYSDEAAAEDYSLWISQLKKEDIKISTQLCQQIKKKFIPNRNSTTATAPSQSTSTIDKTCQKFYRNDFKEICDQHYRISQL